MNKDKIYKKLAEDLHNELKDIKDIQSEIANDIIADTVKTLLSTFERAFNKEMRYKRFLQSIKYDIL